MNNPWQILDCSLKYDNPWIRVEEFSVINPAGNPGIYGTVHFKNRAVAIVPLFENGDTLLVGQFRFPLKEYHWELPMGGAPDDEDPLACAKRELQEETGYSARQWQTLSRLHLSNSITQEEGFAFVARDLVAGEAAPEETEQLAVKRIAFEDALAQAMNGEITDAMTVCALFKVRLMGLA